MRIDDTDKDDPLTNTSVLRQHFGESYRVWIWIRGQFSPTSISIIMSLIVAASTYIAHLRESISALTTRVVVLETRILPVLDQIRDTAVLTSQINDISNRVDRLEEDWDNAKSVAGTPMEKFVRKHPNGR